MINTSVSWFIGLRYVLANKRSRSVAFISRIAMVGIVLGVALLITVLSVMNGFDRELRERILSIMPQVTLYHREGIEDWQSLRQQLLTHHQVVAAAPFVELQGMVNVGKQTEPLLVYGVDADYESSVSIIHKFIEPETLSLLNQSSTAMALGAGLAQRLGIEKGDTLSLIIPRAQGQGRVPAIRRLKVIDILRTKTEVDESLALMGLDGAASLSPKPQRVSGLHLKAPTIFQAPHVARELQSQLPYGFYSSDWTRTHGNVYHAIQMSKNLVSLLLLLIIAIAAFNVVSTLVMVVVDKKTDIAILRTLGLSSGKTVGIFMVQGAMIGIVGTIVGVVLGCGLALSVGNIVAFIEGVSQVQFLSSDIYPVSYLPSQLLWSDILLVMLLSLAMSFLATIYPALRASKVDPAEALRDE